MGLPRKHRPDDSGYEESPRPTELPRDAHDRPDPNAAGNQRAQVATAQQHKVPGTGEPGTPQDPDPGNDDPVPPGEHKREPIHDPDPADTKMHVQQSSR
jgi:hypothetical protein